MTTRAQVEREALAAANLHWRHSSDLRAAANALRGATSSRAEAERILANGHLGWRERRRWRTELEARQQHEHEAAARYEQRAQPEHARLDAEIAHAEHELGALRHDVADYDRWQLDHPDAAIRLRHIDTELARLTVVASRDQRVARTIERVIRQAPLTPEPPAPQLDQGIDLGMDLGL